MECLEEDCELNQIFSKHKQEANKDNIIVVFDKNSVSDNKKLLNAFRANRLITEKTHFSLDDDTDDNSSINERDGYFTEIKENTLKNDSLYCSYLDNFDKTYSKNLTRKNFLSCAGCFNEICIDYMPVKGLSDVFLTQKMTNCFQDYLEVYSVDKVKQLFMNNNTRLDDDITNALGLNNEGEEFKKEFYTMKCYNCYVLVGFYDCELLRYIVINCI
jgi:hypothetical protein